MSACIDGGEESKEGEDDNGKGGVLVVLREGQIEDLGPLYDYLRNRSSQSNMQTRKISHIIVCGFNQVASKLPSTHPQIHTRSIGSFPHKQICQSFRTGVLRELSLTHVFLTGDFTYPVYLPQHNLLV